MKSFIIMTLVVSTILMGCDSSNSRSSKSSAKQLSRSDFIQFGSDPWRGELPIKKGDFIALKINVTTQGTAKVVYFQYDFTYMAYNCPIQTQRDTWVDFTNYNNEKFRQYVGQNVILYGIVDNIEIKRPKHACDDAYASITLTKMEVATQ